jgi:hypothetical protein
VNLAAICREFGINPHVLGESCWHPRNASHPTLAQTRLSPPYSPQSPSRQVDVDRPRLLLHQASGTEKPENPQETL